MMRKRGIPRAQPGAMLLRGLLLPVILSYQLFAQPANFDVTGAIVDRHSTWIHNLIVQGTQPADGRSRPVGQIPDFDGVLQTYANSFNSIASADIRLPFGGSFVLPIAKGRVELSGSAGSVYVPYATPYSRPNAWLSQATVGVHVALDPEHRVWLGAGAYYLTDFADRKRQWGFGTADLIFRFGK